MKWAAGTAKTLSCRTLRVLFFHCDGAPGVPLRFTPGFMLAPAARVHEPHEVKSRVAFL
jgi:hypothetical protein